MSDVIDIDALVPPSVTIKFDGQQVEVQPPKTVDTLRLAALGQKLKDADKLAETEIEKVITDITSTVYKCIPELTNKDFNTAQLLKLVEIIGNMSIPPDTKDLANEGITLEGPKVPQG